VAREPVAAFTFRVARDQDPTTLPAGELFAIDGTVDVIDAAIAVEFVTVKVIRPSDTKPVSMMGTILKPTKEGTRYNYAGEIRAPRQPGTNEVEARADISGSKHAVGRTTVQVLAK
jgi:hypothetical protein